MGTEDGRNILGDLIESHEGLPTWFPSLVAYILECLKNRDRFSLYHARVVLQRTWTRTVIYSSDIRDVLGPLERFGLSYRGKQRQMVQPSDTMISFWASFYLPAQATPVYDLSFFARVLLRRRHQDLTRDVSFHKFLPVGYKSLSKERLVALLLRRLFESSESYESYAEAKRNELSSGARRICRNLSAKAKALAELPSATEGYAGAAAMELCDSLLAKPAYLEYEGRLYLHLAHFSGHANPLRLPKAALLEPPGLRQCLQPILGHVLACLEGEGRPSRDDQPPLRFPWGQLRLLEENETEAKGVLDFLAWWREVLGSTPIKTDQLPDNYTVSQGPNGACRILAIDGYSPRLFVEKAREFNLLHRDRADRIVLTGLGDWAGGGAEPDLGVQEKWGRNVDRIALKLLPDWPEEFRRLLQKVATFKDDVYTVRREDILERKIPISHLLPILGGFVKLDAKRLARLHRWYSSIPLPKVLQASAILIGDDADRKILLEAGQQIYEVDGYYIIVGMSPSQLIKSLQLDQPG